MLGRRMLAGVVIILVGMSTAVAASLEQLSYPELIVYNGKIVTVDNRDFTTNLGTISQAMAIRGGKILAMGATADVRSLAGPQTRSIDLKGRTVLPGIIITHEHPDDWAPISPQAWGKVITDDIIVSRYLTGTPQEQFARLQPTLVELVKKAKPGQWIRIYMYRGKMKEYSRQLVADLPRLATKSMLDGLAPNNPVQIKGAQNTVLNGKALDILLKESPTLPFIYNDKEKVSVKERGVGGPDLYRHVEAALLFKNNSPLLAKVYKAELDFWASLGMTAYGSAVYDSAALRALHYLDERGEMPVRHGWSYTGPDFSPEALDYFGSMVGGGTDYLWLNGAWPTAGGTCTTINARPEVKKRENCSFGPGSKGATDMYNIIHSGLRVTGMHTWGDKDIDNFMDIIEKASKDAGMTLDEIRAKRHVFDHAAVAPRPSQYERIKRLGMMVSASSTFNYWYTPELVANYGEEYANWCVPRKSLSEFGIMNSFETDSPLSQDGTTLFEVAWYDMTRRASDGKVHGPAEKIDRQRELKVMTTWGAYNLYKEKLIGSLETGKFGDFIVLDRDYLTIPEDDMPKIKVLATVVGGKFVWSAPEFASQ